MGSVPSHSLNLPLDWCHVLLQMVLVVHCRCMLGNQCTALTLTENGCCGCIGHWVCQESSKAESIATTKLDRQCVKFFIQFNDESSGSSAVCRGGWHPRWLHDSERVTATAGTASNGATTGGATVAEQQLGQLTDRTMANSTARMLI